MYKSLYFAQCKSIISSALGRTKKMQGKFHTMVRVPNMNDSNMRRKLEIRQQELNFHKNFTVHHVLKYNIIKAFISEWYYD